MRALHLVLTLVVLGACIWWERPRADGGVEYLLPDGGWAGAGDACGCEHVAEQLVADDGNGRVLLTCAVACADNRSTTCTDAGAAVCFGVGCCTWQ